jgi:hypothetical protein
MSIFDEIKDFAKKEIVTADDAVQGILFLSKKQEQLYKMYSEALKTFETYDPVKRAVELVDQKAQDLLFINGMEAIEKAEEFDVPAYRGGWINAITNPESLLLFTVGENLKIINNFDSTAGTIGEYAKAVDIVRGYIGDPKDGDAGVGSENPDYEEVSDPAFWQSWFWAEKFYNPARNGQIGPLVDPDKVSEYVRSYWETMDARASHFTHDAPYWSLVEDGLTAMVQGKGTAYPATQPTKFIQKTIEAVQEFYRNSLNSCKAYKTKLESSIKELESAYATVTELLNRKTNVDLVEYGKKKVQVILEKKYPTAENNKFSQLVQDIIDGKDLPERVSLGKTPEGKRLRPRLTQLKAEIDKYKKLSE